RADHRQREGRIPRARHIQETENLGRIDQPGNEKPEPEDEAGDEGAQCIHRCCSVAAQLPIMWRTTNTVTNPAAMNDSVATIERGDRRDIPHTPWPLVQPAPYRVPMPTSKPATINVG